MINLGLINDLLMKRLFLLMLPLMMLASCGDDSGVIGGTENPTPDINPTETRATQMFVQGKEISYTSSTRAAGDENTATAHFFVRIDGNIPEIKDDYCPSEQYLPQDKKGSKDMTLVCDANAGEINLDYAYSSEGVIWPITRYVYDSTGKEVNKVIIKEPDLKTLLASNKNTDFNDVVSKLDLDECKVIWYVAREGQSNGWHVDGVLTMKSTTDVTEIPGMDIDEDKDYTNSASKPTLPEDAQYGNGNVEVNVHQQLHKDWEEIKTSIHVRDLVDGVKVEIPLEYDNVAEADDFAIRTYDYTINSKVFLNGTDYVQNDTNPIQIKVEHLASKVVITVSAINHEYIKNLRKAYGDGVTVEVHTYPKNQSKDQIWQKVQASTVTVSPASYDSSKIKVSRTRYAATEE